MTRLKQVAGLMVLTMLGFAAINPAWADGFPGKGNAGDWSDALPYYNLANKYLAEERFDEAAQKYQEAINLYPYDPDFYTNLGVALRKLEDYAGAEQAFRKAIQLDGKDWVPWSDLANACLKQNRLKDAVGVFQETLKHNPPAKEKLAIQQDINDLNKFIRMQGGADSPAGKPETAKTARGKGGRDASAAANSSAAKGISSRTASSGSNNAPPVDNKAMKDSGWDWSYK